MAETKKVLLHLEDVKMHFPLKKAKILQRERSFVKAVDGVTIDIYEGETFGLVGESGCGKSTLGRVILQLYNQTAGTIRYNGITFDDYAPGYASKIIAGIPQTKGKSAGELAAKHMEQVRLAGGLLLADNLSEVTHALSAKLSAVAKESVVSSRLNLLELKRVAHLENEKISASDKKRLTLVEKRMKPLAAELEALRKVTAEKEKALENIRKKCAEKAGFSELEEKVDHSIDLSRLTKEEVRRLRRDLQVVFQDPYSSLNPRFTVGQLISEALVAHKMFERGTQQLEDYTIGVMNKCGLQNYMLHRYPHQFSGGQRQRIGIARALALQPKFVVCDEAVSALDVSIQSQVINLLMDLKESSNLTYLFISHDLSTVKFISDRVGVMYLGNIIELGDSDTIFAEPLHPYTNALLEAIPTTDEASKKALQVIEGDIPSPINPPPGCKFHTRCKYATDKCRTEVPEWREFKERHWVACHYPVLKSESAGA